MTGSEQWRTLKAYWWLPVPVVFGIVVRCYALADQILAGDELHAVRAALRLPFSEVLVTYRLSDNCIPLTAMYRLLMSLGVELSEFLLRLPVLLSGLLTLVLVPLWASRRVEVTVGHVLAWLLAMSPTLVYYHRIVRSYGLIVLLGFGAAIFFEHWYRTRTWKSGVGYVCCGVLAVYSHLVAGPFVFSPFLFLVGAKLLKPHAKLASWSEMAVIAGGSVVGLLSFLIPAWPTLRRLIEMKHEASELSFRTLQGVAAMQSGTGLTVLAVLFWLAAVRGLWILYSRHPRLAVYSLVLVLGQFAGLLVLSPKAFHQAPIFNRYMLITMPFVLLWVAAGLGASWSGSSMPRWRKLQLVTVALLLALFFAAGPLVTTGFHRSSFAHEPGWLLFFSPRLESPLPERPIYAALDPKVAGAVLEYPWHPMWRYARVFSRYQTTHGRRVMVTPGEQLLWDDRLSFRQMIPPDRFLSSGAAYLVIHLDLGAEERELDRKGMLTRDIERRQRELRKICQQAARRAENLERRWGPPDLADDGIKVWNLERIRSRTGHRDGDASRRHSGGR